MFSYCLIYIYCLSRNSKNSFVFNQVLFFVIFYPESLKVIVNTETGTFNPQYWNFGTSHHALLSLEALIHLNMFYIDSYVPFLPCGLFISSKVQKCQQKC